MPENKTDEIRFTATLAANGAITFNGDGDAMKAAGIVSDETPRLCT